MAVTPIMADSLAELRARWRARAAELRAYAESVANAFETAADDRWLRNPEVIA